MGGHPDLPRGDHVREVGLIRDRSGPIRDASLSRLSANRAAHARLPWLPRIKNRASEKSRIFKHLSQGEGIRGQGLSAAEAMSELPPSERSRLRGAEPGADSPPQAPVASEYAEGDVAGRVVEKLARLDKEQLRGLVEDLRLALLEAVPATEAATTAPVATESIDPPDALDPELPRDPPAEVAVAPALALVVANRSREARPQARRSVPRRVGAVLASGFLATVAASLLLVPAANPPAQPVAVAPHAARAGPAPADASKPAATVTEIVDAGPAAVHEPIAVKETSKGSELATPDKGALETPAALPNLAPAAGPE